MRVLAFPECLCCAACSASLSPFVFHGSRPELLATADSLHCQRIFTMVCGSGLCSTSFPGGHQVDGLPPASSTGAGVIGQRGARDKVGIFN